MRHFSQGRFGQQARFLQQQFLQDGNLPFSDILSTGLIEQALTALQVGLVNCVYTPLVTLRVFLGQVLSADHSCRAAVARLIAYRVARKQRACSPETGAYCQARKRLPEEFFSQIARQTGRQLDAKAKSEWLWKNRRVHIFDGATVSMPDTYANQQAYPQPPQQKPGLGFPLMRIAVIFSLACGAVLDVGMCRYAGKGQSELALLRQLWSIFQPGSIMLADRLMCAWTELVMLKQRDVDCVCRFNSANRKTDFRRGKRLGKDDHIVTWFKPTKPRSIDRQTYNTLPESLTIRECRVPIAQPGFRVKVVVIATTLLDHIAYPPSELAALYRARWNAELDLRSLKRTMQMDVLRCKTPELVRKELWTHILAYNLIRTIIAQAAHKHHLEPRSLSFKGAIQTLEAFQPVIALQGEHDAAHRLSLYQILLDAIATHRVADRPDRYEPRAWKGYQKKFAYLRKPRAQAKREMAKGLTEN
jgi:Transposase DDE domain